METPRLKAACRPGPPLHSSPTRPSSAIHSSLSPSRWAGTGTLSAETMAITTVSAVSMASRVPISGRSERGLGCSPDWPPSSRTMALAPVTDTMRPIDRSECGLVRSASAAGDDMSLTPSYSLSLRAADVDSVGDAQQIHVRDRGRRRQHDDDLGAERLLAVDLQVSAVQLDEGLGNRQAEPRAFPPARAAGIDLCERCERDDDLLLRHA